jgi:hypothetical protein
MATVFASADAAGAQGMHAEGTKIDAPQLGDASAAFRQVDSGDGDAPTVTYTLNVRRGSMVMSTQETGVTYSFDSPDEVFGMATALDGRAAQLLTQ